MHQSNKTHMLVIMAALIAIQIVLSRVFSINAWNIKIGFGFVPIVMAGILFGPVPAAAVGALSDFLGAVLLPIGPYFPGFTLTAALTGMVYGLLLHEKQSGLRILGAEAVVQFVLSLLINTFWISLLYGSPFGPLFQTRVVQCAILAPVEFVVIDVLAKYAARMGRRLAV